MVNMGVLYHILLRDGVGPGTSGSGSAQSERGRDLHRGEDLDDRLLIIAIRMCCKNIERRHRGQFSCSQRPGRAFSRQLLTEGYAAGKCRRPKKEVFVNRTTFQDKKSGPDMLKNNMRPVQFRRWVTII